MGRNLHFPKTVAAGVLFIASLVACSSPHSESEITIKTAIPVQAPSNPNISSKLSNLMSITLGSECYQNQIYALIFDPAADKIVATKKLLLRTKMNAALPSPTPITYSNGSVDVTTVINRLLADSHLDEPIKLVIPRDRNVEVAIVGHFYNPSDSTLDGICDETSGSFAMTGSSIFGHGLVDGNVRASGSITLKVDVMHTNPSGVYSLASPPNRYKDWVQFSNTYNATGYSVRLKKVNYLTASPTQDGLITLFVDNNSATKYYVPHIFPYILDFYATDGSNSGNYRAFISNGNASGIGVSANLIQVIAGTPASTLTSSAGAGNTFTIDTY